jgi:hypothetical protein
LRFLVVNVLPWAAQYCMASRFELDTSPGKPPSPQILALWCSLFCRLTNLKFSCDQQGA